MEAIPYRRLFLTVAAYAGLVCIAVAQPPGPRGGRDFGPPRGPGGPGGPGGALGMGMLLRAPEVQDELELTEDQNAELRELAESVRERMRDEMRSRFQAMREGGGDREAMREEMRGAMEGIREEVEGRMGEVLTTQQMDRLKQINVQQQIDRGGARALMGGPVADALDLTDDQKEQLRERAREVRAEMDQKIKAAREEARMQLMEILTSEQKAKLDEMTGEPFAMNDRPRGPEFGRGGREGRRGRPGPPGRGRDGEGRRGRPGPPPESREF